MYTVQSEVDNQRRPLGPRAYAELATELTAAPSPLWTPRIPSNLHVLRMQSSALVYTGPDLGTTGISPATTDERAGMGAALIGLRAWSSPSS